MLPYIPHLPFSLSPSDPPIKSLNPSDRRAFYKRWNQQAGQRGLINLLRYFLMFLTTFLPSPPFPPFSLSSFSPQRTESLNPSVRRAFYKRWNQRAGPRGLINLLRYYASFVLCHSVTLSPLHAPYLLWRTWSLNPSVRRASYKRWNQRAGRLGLINLSR